MPISRVTARWSGFPGAPGYSNFHFQASTGTPDVEADAQLVQNFFTAIRTTLPTSVSVEVQQTVEILDDATGQLVSYVTLEEPFTPVSGSGTAAYSGPTGAVINWLTNSVIGGRRVRGRTFIVPCNTTSYQTDGTLTPQALTTLNTGAAILSGAGFGSGFGILTRPAGGGAIGFSEVTGHRVPDLAAVLRSRRD